MSVDKRNYAICWIVIYPAVDTLIHLSNIPGQEYFNSSLLIHQRATSSADTDLYTRVWQKEAP